MSGFLPARRSKWWFGVFLLYIVIVFAFFAATRGIVLKRPINGSFMYTAVLLSIVVAFIACVFGYFNAKVVFIVLTAGVLAGTIMMVVAFSRKNGWEDLIGLVLFFELSLLGLAAGVLLEVVYFIYRVTKDKKKKAEKDKKIKDEKEKSE